MTEKLTRLYLTGLPAESIETALLELYRYDAGAFRFRLVLAPIEQAEAPDGRKILEVVFSGRIETELARLTGRTLAQLFELGDQYGATLSRA